MKVLITGGAGFIGSHVAETFYEAGYEIFILDNYYTGKLSNVTVPFTNIERDINEPCEDIFQKHRFDTVVHLAAQVSVAKSVTNPVNDAVINIIGLLNMLVNARANGVRKFIFASSAAIYGNNDHYPLLEKLSPSPIAPYGLSKLTGEHYCQLIANESHLQTVCLRFSNVYGPRQNGEGEGGVISIFVQNAISNKALEIHGDGTQTRDFIYVKDVARAIYLAAISDLQGTFNICSHSETSVNQIIEIIEQFSQPLIYSYTAARKGDIKHSILHNGSFSKKFNWKPSTPLQVGLQQTYQWMLRHQLLNS